MTVVFARGTTEAGNAGTVVGPPFLQAIRKLAPGLNVNMQGVPYPANFAGIMAGGDRQGTAKMANIIKTLATDCPNTGIVISGYSQGAMLMHNAAAQLDPETASHVVAAVSFGDPFRRRPVNGVDQSRTLVVCHAGDNVCQGGGMILPAHLTYGQDVGKAAAFVMEAAAAVVASMGAAQGTEAAPGTEAVPGAGAVLGAGAVPGTGGAPGTEAAPGTGAAPGTEALPSTGASPGAQVVPRAEGSSGARTLKKGPRALPGPGVHQ
ncbi:hypothetical protein MCOR02_007482 [Pyricularia oryzae]|nr:hypothetical protein MCOR02_007482 [Pyricularia oryzae]